MPKLLIATTNPAKAREYKEFLTDLNCEIISLVDLKKFVPVKEIGSTFEENAVLKAKGYYTQTNYPAIADDGGLVIDALNGEPGVKSHRWLGYVTTDEDLVKHALQRMKGIPWEKRTARLETVLAFYDGKNLLIEKEAIVGFISEQYPSRMEKGFPWRSILFLPEYGKLYQDLTEKEHEKINHRKKMVERLKPRLLSI